MFKYECVKFSTQSSAIVCELDFTYLRNLGKGEVIISLGQPKKNDMMKRAYTFKVLGETPGFNTSCMVYIGEVHWGFGLFICKM